MKEKFLIQKLVMKSWKLPIFKKSMNFRNWHKKACHHYIITWIVIRFLLQKVDFILHLKYFVKNGHRMKKIWLLKLLGCPKNDQIQHLELLGIYNVSSLKWKWWNFIYLSQYLYMMNSQSKQPHDYIFDLYDS